MQATSHRWRRYVDAYKIIMPALPRPRFISSRRAQRFVRAGLSFSSDLSYLKHNPATVGLRRQHVPGESQAAPYLPPLQIQTYPAHASVSTPTRPPPSASGSHSRSVHPRTARSRSSPARTSPHRSRSASCASPRAGRALRPSSRRRRSRPNPRVNTSWRRACPVRPPPITAHAHTHHVS